MKYIRLATTGGLFRALAATVLFTFGLELRLPAPPATPVPTYYDPINGDFGLGATLDLVPDGSGGLEIGDWNIPTDQGDLTPLDSVITAGADFPGQSFLDVFTDITLDPVQFESTTGPLMGSYWNVELGPIGASITDPNGGVSYGAFVVPDYSPTWVLLVMGTGVLLLGRGKHQFQHRA